MMESYWPTAADAPDVHAGAQADMLDAGEGLDLALVVNVFLVFSHDIDIIPDQMAQGDVVAKPVNFIHRWRIFRYQWMRLD